MTSTASPKKLKVVCAGFSGLIGKPLTKALASKYEVIQLVRGISQVAGPGSVKRVSWDPAQAGSWMDEIDGAYAVINLSGENIAGKRWSKKQKEELLHSRVSTTKALTHAIIRAKARPSVFLNASAIGFYGARDSSRVSETAKQGSGFLPDMSAAWEKEAAPAADYGVRVVFLRTGIVLSKDGGALEKMATPFKLFIGGPLGNGKQMMSWIHVDDEVAAILKALEDSQLKGPLNLTAPNAVSMNEFSRVLARALNRPCLAPVPGFALKLLLGEMADMLLTGQNVYPQGLLDAGFKFKYDTLEPALKDLLR